MRIGIVGFGYIGSVCTAGLINDVDQIMIVDPDLSKTESVRNNCFRFPEQEVEQIINNSHVAVANGIKNIVDLDLIMICVNTPLRKDGSLDDSILREVLTELSEVEYKGIVVIRSTLPYCQSTFEFVDNCNLDIFVVPEFLREGSALEDFRNGEVLVIGKQRASEQSKLNVVKNVFGKYFKMTVEMELRSAVYLKLLNNTWHATKVAFANEWWRLAEKLGISDVDQIYLGLISDHKLNTSSKYMRPGGPFGGPCLTKDIAEFNSLGSDFTQEITQAVVRSNIGFVKELSQQIMEICVGNYASFAFDTLEFKSGTNDERHSPLLDVIQYILEHSDLKYEENMSMAECIFSGRKILDTGRVEIVKK